ncbi:MAG TPA: hypothetical protein VGB30_06520 [bacterium]|jgi:hypothetical protein
MNNQTSRDKHRKSDSVIVAEITAVCIILVFIGVTAINSYLNAMTHEKERHGIEAIIEIQTALESYAESNNGSYPLSINDLDITLPQNQFTGESIRNVEISDREAKGNFSYIPILQEDAVQGYFLIRYGDPKYSKTTMLDIDLPTVKGKINRIFHSDELEEILNTQ